MAKINTKELLIDYVRTMLGEPVITVQLTDKQIELIIDSVIEKFSEFAYDGQDIRYMVVPIFEGVKEYKIDSRIASIIELKVNSLSNSLNPVAAFSIPDGYTVSSQTSASSLSLADYETTLARYSKFDYMFDVSPAYTFNSNNSILTFHEDMSRHHQALIQVALEYEPGEVDGIFNHPWIKEMTLAKCRYQWGNNVGKYSGTLINGNTINYSDMKSEGQADIERLDEELLTRWSPPLGITVG